MRHKPKHGSPGAICAESMSFPRFASAAAKMAMAWGGLVTTWYAPPICQASPQEIKRALCGRADASKLDVEQAQVFRKQGNRDVRAMRAEAIQVAAMAIRFVKDVCDALGGQR